MQAVNANTGAFDPAAEICAWAHAAGAWVHVDGAFGIWAAASPRYAHLVDGVAAADSWATDAQRWDRGGFPFCARTSVAGSNLIDIGMLRCTTDLARHDTSLVSASRVKTHTGSVP